MIPNSTWTAIMGVNDYGDLVGFTITSDGSHGFLWKHTNVITFFNAPGAGPNSDITYCGNERQQSLDCGWRLVVL